MRVLLSDSIRNVIYPASFFLAVGSLWTLAWSNKLAEHCNRLDGPLPCLSNTQDETPAKSPESFAPAKADAASVDAISVAAIDKR